MPIDDTKRWLNQLPQKWLVELWYDSIQLRSVPSTLIRWKISAINLSPTTGTRYFKSKHNALFAFGGEGGIDVEPSLARHPMGALMRVQIGFPADLSNPGGFSSLPLSFQLFNESIAGKSKHNALFAFGGEGGIRTLGTQSVHLISSQARSASSGTSPGRRRGFKPVAGNSITFAGDPAAWNLLTTRGHRGP